MATVEIKKIELPYQHSFGRYLYVVRVRQRKCMQMDYYLEKVHDFGAYESQDMAECVAEAIKKGEIIVDMDV